MGCVIPLAAGRPASRRPRMAVLGLVMAATLVLGSACGSRQPVDGHDAASPSTALSEPTSTSTTAAAVTLPMERKAEGEEAAAATIVEVRYRIERHTDDTATEGFEEVVRATLSDLRGWMGAGFRLVEDPAAPYVVVLAEPAEVDRLCAPYDTNGRWSCQNGPVVALNADRWRSATEKWTADLESYRVMLVNHEVGHLLGQHHPDPQCPAPGQPAPVMAQQSTELDGCLPNPWPLDWELALAARHEEPLAPPPPPHRR